MRKSIVKAALLIIGLTSAGYATGGGLGGPRPIPPVILSATAHFTDNRVVISGRHFGSNAPTVTLARRVLKVYSFSESAVVVDLPTGIAPATYRLTLTNGPNRLSSGTFSAAIYALAGR